MNFVADVFERAVVFANGKAVLDDKVKTVFMQKEVLDMAYLEQPDIVKLSLELKFRETYLNTEEFIRLSQELQ